MQKTLSAVWTFLSGSYVKVQSFLLYWQLIGSFNEIIDHKHRSLRNMLILDVHFNSLLRKNIFFLSKGFNSTELLICIL